MNAISDAGAGAQLALAAFRSAALNVRINLLGLEADPEPARLLDALGALETQVAAALQAVDEALLKRAGLRASLV